MSDDKDSIEAFYSGIICALKVVIDGHGKDVIAIDIMKCCDMKAVRRIAKREKDASIVELIDNYRRLQRQSD